MGIRINIFFWVLSLCCGAVALYLMLTLENRQQDIDRSYLSYVKTLKLSDELRQSSDDLTRFARAYAATGGAAYIKQFETVLGIRDGSIPRPEGYGRARWYLEYAGISDDTETGDTRPLRDRLIDAGLDDQSISDLGASQKLSSDLAEIENDAFRLIELGNSKLALELLYSWEYEQTKNRIMAPVNRVQARIDQKGEKELQVLLVRYHGTQTAIVALILASLIFGALAGLYRRYALRLHLENDALTGVRASSE
jgi:methyl-accepting chemotaxis protein